MSKSLSGSQKIKSTISNVLFKVDKYPFIKGSGYDFYRKAVLPASAVYDYIQYPGSEAPKKKEVIDGKLVRVACNSYIGSFICECHKSKKSKMQNCKSQLCKLCQHKTILRQVRRITKRYLDVQDLEGQDLRFEHYTFNMDTMGSEHEHAKEFKFDTYEQYKKNRRILLRILKRYGVFGLRVNHPWRKDRELTFKNGVPYVKKGFHFHVLGRFEGLPMSPDFLEKHGFTYKNITFDQYKKDQKKPKGKRKNLLPYISTIKHFENITRYLLSHTGYFGKHRASYSYIGGFSPYFYKRVNETKEVVPVECETCFTNLSKIEQFYYNMIDGLLILTKSYTKKKDARGFMMDNYLYLGSELHVDKEKYLRKQLHKYDYIYKNDYKAFLEGKKSCDTCDYRKLSDHNKEIVCGSCENFSNYDKFLPGGFIE